jgi:hypothetical protein
MARTTSAASSERSADTAIPAWAEQLVRFMDDGFVIPGTSFRVGFDALIGLIPGVGDLVTTATSLSLIGLAHRRGLPKAVLARMILNLGIDSLVGAIPVLGDVFDVTFKANRRNLTLLQRHDRDARRASARDRLFLALAALGAITALVAPIVATIWFLRWLSSSG